MRPLPLKMAASQLGGLAGLGGRARFLSVMGEGETTSLGIPSYGLMCK